VNLRVEERELEAGGSTSVPGAVQDSADTACLEVTVAAILFVRINSGLEAEEFERRLLERRPRFRDVPGLVQKIYGRDDATGDVCGIYFFENEEALAAFRETELARAIPAAFEAVDVRREAYDVLYPLWPDRGPLSVDSWIDERKLESGAQR
jgi:Putative mono-oxygenase ydhR